MRWGVLFSVEMDGWHKDVDMAFEEARRAGRSLILTNQQKDPKWSLTVIELLEI